MNMDQIMNTDYLTVALGLAELLDGEAYVEIASAIAIQYAETGELDPAVELAEQIPDVYARDSALAVIAAKAVASEHGDYALELLNTIEDPILYNSAIEGMAVEFAGLGKFDTALELTDQLSDNASSLASIAAVYWQRGLKSEAIDLAQSIEFAQQSATTLVQLARLSDDKAESLELLAEAQSVAEEIDSAELQVFAFMSIASGYEDQAEREPALAALNRAVEVCGDIESASLMGLSADFAKDEALLQIVEAFLRLDDLSTATELAEEIEDRFVFARANLSLAVARGKGGEPSGAAKHLEEAKAMIVETEVYGLQEANVRDGLIIDLAMAYANRGDYAEARRIIELVTSPETQVLALKELGKLCAGAGDEREVFDIAEGLGSAYDKTQYWLGVYDATTSCRPELSETAMAKASTIATSVEQPVEKAEALTQIALRFAKNQKEQTENAFLVAGNAATLIDGNFLKARAFLRLAKASQVTTDLP
jgi:tetratricopeptide (TPR) repeat protein